MTLVELIRKLLHLLTFREKIQGGVLLLGMVAAALLEMVGVGAIPVFISTLTDPDMVRDHPVGRRAMALLGISTGEELVLAGAGALLVLFVVKNTYLTALTWMEARYVFDRQVSIARRLFSAYVHRPYVFHLGRNTAELLRNTNQDAMQVVGAGLMPALRLAKETLTVSAILILLLRVEPITSLAAFVILGGTTAFFLHFVRRRILRLGEEERLHRGGMMQAVTEGLGGIKAARVLGREEHFLADFNTASEGYARTGRGRQVLLEVPRLTLEVASVAGILGVAALLLLQGRAVASLVPMLALLAIAVVRMIPSFNQITTSLNHLRFGRAAIRGVYDDLTEPQEDVPDDSGSLSFDRSIRIEELDFRYPGAGVPSLRNVSLEVPKGSTVGLVGPTGSGKTTLVDVVLGLLPPSEGRVLVDGQDIRGRERAWQRHLGYIPQDIFLSDASILQNIAFGLSEEEIDEEAAWRAVDAAQVKELVERLPDRLHTVVGERGVRLSGGQRQRIGIARALYHDPDVLIMDEATSALDNETERYVMDAIHHLRGSLTLIIVAHRLSTVKACDRLFFLQDGRIVREGTYAALQLESPEFRRMIDRGSSPTGASDL